MTYDSLADFLATIDDDGELKQISSPVDSVLEISEITDRVSKMPGGGPALFFQQVKNSAVPVVTNLLGSETRLCRALRVSHLSELVSKLTQLLQPDLPNGFLETLQLIPRFAPLLKTPPTLVRSGICQQVVKLGRDVNLAELPLPHAWPGDAAPAVTSGQVFTKDPEHQTRNVGLYPLQMQNRDGLFLYWSEHSDGFAHYRRWQQTGEHMPIAVALGGDPINTFLAATPLHHGVDECLLGGYLRERSIEMVKCRTIDLSVPANAEIVLEGQIDPQLPWETAGPMGSVTGFYSEPRPAPLMRVTAITHRSNPVLPAMIFGRPPCEQTAIDRGIEQILLPLLRLTVPEVIDFHLPRFGAFRNYLFVSIRKQYPAQARKVMNALWGFGRLMVSKMIVVVDEQIDVHNPEEVWFHVGANTHPGRDVIFSEGPTDVLDHAAPVRGLGHKMGIDATRKLSGEEHQRPWPKPIEMPQEIKELVSHRWSEYGLL